MPPLLPPGPVRFEEGGVHRVRTRGHSVYAGMATGLLVGGVLGFAASQLARA